MADDAVRGMLTLDELARRVGAGTIDTVLVVMTDLYGRQMGKRYDAEFFLADAVEGGSHACDYLLTTDVGMEPVPGYDFANWQTGYGDVHLVPDLATLRVASWLDRTAMVLCDVADVRTHDPVAVAPRSLLRRQIARAAELGYEARAGSELEFYMFRDTYAEAAELGYANLRPTGWYIEDYHALQGARAEDFVGAVRRHLRDSGVPVENSKGEWGLGQHELNVRYAEVLEMADRHVVYKQCVKETADRMGRCATFMAKPDESKAGSSCHVHLSLWKDGESAFAGDSETFRRFLAGWIEHASEVMPFYAPNPNSYKRYQAASWAPTSLTWSYDNRTAGFRVVGKGASQRIECRIPGADCNPYLVYAAALASGLDGIDRSLEPPPAFEGDAYAGKDVRRVPRSLSVSTDAFAKSEFTRRVFGDDVVAHYEHFFRTEQAAYDRAVTDWERRRYFEQI